MPSKKSAASAARSPAEVASAGLHDGLAALPGHLFRRGQQICVAAFYKALGPDITPLQYGVLRVVGQFPGSDQVTLARLLFLDNATTAEIATRLERKGLLRRELQVVLRRQRLLYLTEEGTALIANLERGVGQLSAGMLGRLEPQEAADLMRLLRRFVEVNSDSEARPLGTSGSGSPLKAPLARRAPAAAGRSKTTR